MSTHSNEALAIKMGDRYFYRFGNKGQVLTAWHLAGAKLFMNKVDAIPSLSKLAQKKKKCEIIKVGVLV